MWPLTELVLELSLSIQLMRMCRLNYTCVSVAEATFPIDLRAVKRCSDKTTKGCSVCFMVVHAIVRTGQMFERAACRALIQAFPEGEREFLGVGGQPLVWLTHSIILLMLRSSSSPFAFMNEEPPAQDCACL